ncbi:MAG: serine hydrolase [Bacteroidales bacterium]|nr:serine hydrolase [Bacteroidales bacterium]MCF8388538.1 serine hydrolase [Bacteroidales bacterium]MCF8398470.1 serine hydrolase [Bacteroidales bacterium]
MKRIILLFLVSFFVIPSFAQRSLKKKLKDLDTYYSESLEKWEVPGMAIAIVKNDSIVFEKGYGVLEIDEQDRVDQYSMFPIASNTKAFTAAALGILVEEGKLKWDDKVREQLPWFELYDPYVTCNMTVRDLLCHRSGLKTFSGDLIWYGTDYNRQEVVERARYLEPVYGFRAHYGYSNIMYIAAGLVVEKISGMRWDEFLNEHFFEPLKMQRTITSTSELPGYQNVATPHTTYQDEVIAIPYLNWDNVGPAGSIISSVHDVSQWLRMQLNNGVYEGDTLFGERTALEMWSPQTIQGVNRWTMENMPTHFKSYGLGWALMDYHGKKVVSHGGGYDGMISQTAMVPEEDLGIVILTNKNAWLILPVLYETLDIFLAEHQKDWNEFYLEFWNKRKEAEKKRIQRLEDERIRNTSPSLPLNEYTGLYHDKMYGDAEIKLTDGKLRVQLLPAPEFKGRMEHYHFDTFEIEFYNFPSLPTGLVNFNLDEKGKVASMLIDVPNPDFDFTEMKFVKQ